MMLPEPLCSSGYPWYQIKEEILDAGELAKFSDWMYGQTMSICNGRRYSHETKEYQESCGGVAHGGVVYPWDLQRFLAGRPIID